jgi:acetoin utilization deacetylase AcuC-like enzyme
MARTGLVYDSDMLLHDTGPGHVERPARLTAIMEAFEAAGLHPPRIPITLATEEDLLRVHTEDHVAEIKQTCAINGCYPDPDTPMVEASWRAALLAAGGTISACKAVLDGTVDNAFCVVRPPGHHAEADRAMGFCLFNNIAIAARWLRDVAQLERVAIFDWDIHHGNGTQHAFYNDPTVFYASMHQHPHYPGTGWPFERGSGRTPLTIQMPRGCGPEEWLDAIDHHVLPALQAFDPTFFLISAGFDTHKLDPLGGQLLESDTYAVMTNRLKGLAGGKLVSTLEGGYNLEALAESCVAHFRALQGDL